MSQVKNWKLLAIAGVILATAVYVAPSNEEHQDLGAGREQGYGPSAVPHPEVPSSLSERTAAGAHLSNGEVAQTGACPGQSAGASSALEGPEPYGGDAGSNPALATISRDLADGFMPTAEGLYAATIELWEQPEFALGRDLPTHEDCERGLGDPIVLEALTLYQAISAHLADVYAWPDHRRGETYEKVVRALDAARVSAGWTLCMRLDEVTAFRGWTDLWQEYEEWSAK